MRETVAQNSEATPENADRFKTICDNTLNL